MVTNQQQLEYAAKHIEKWKSGYDYAVIEETTDGHLYIRWPSIFASGVTKKEWQQERGKMSSKPAPDNSWHERGEFPPPETYCQFQKSGTEYGLVNCFVIGIDDLGFCVCRVDMDYHASMSASDFRPCRTEREKSIDEMLIAIDHIKEGNFETFIGALYDAGYRKEQSK